MGKGAYLGGSTIIRLDPYGPEQKQLGPKTKRPPRPQSEREWLAANKRSKPKPIDQSSRLEVEYRAATKRRRRRGKKKRA